MYRLCDLMNLVLFLRWGTYPTLAHRAAGLVAVRVTAVALLLTIHLHPHTHTSPHLRTHPTRIGTCASVIP